MKNATIFFLLIFPFFKFSCNKKERDIVKYKRHNYFKDEYTIFNYLDKNVSSKNNYVSVRNDSIFLLEKYDCNVWLLGVLRDNEESISLNNGCGKSTFTSHIRSKTKIYNLNKKELFIIELSLGYNSLNSNDIKRILIYSKEEGIISIFKNDTLLFNNLDW